MKTTKVHVVVGVFAGVVDEVVVDVNEAVAKANYQRLCIMYDFDPVHASESEHDVQLTSVPMVLYPVLDDEEITDLAYHAVEAMGDVFWDADRWGEPHQCPNCGGEYEPTKVQGLAKSDDGCPLCPKCNGVLQSANECLREAVEGSVQQAIRAALDAAVGKDDPRARLAELLATYEAEHNAYAKGREAQDWVGYGTQEAEADGQAQGLMWGLKHALTLLRMGRFEFAQSLAMQGYVEEHEDDIGDVQALELREEVGDG